MSLWITRGQHLLSLLWEHMLLLNFLLLLEHMFPLKFSTMLLLERFQHQLCVDFQNNCRTPMESSCQCSRAAGKIWVAFHYSAAITVSHGQLFAQQVNVKRPYRVLRGTICLSLSLVPGLLTSLYWLNRMQNVSPRPSSLSIRWIFTCHLPM